MPWKCKKHGFIPRSGVSPEKDMATDSSIFARKISWQRSVSGCSTWVLKSEVDMTERVHVCSRAGRTEGKSPRGKSKNMGFAKPSKNWQDGRILALAGQGDHGSIRGWGILIQILRILFWTNLAEFFIKTGFYKDRDGSRGLREPDQSLARRESLFHALWFNIHINLLRWAYHWILYLGKQRLKSAQVT